MANRKNLKLPYVLILCFLAGFEHVAAQTLTPVTWGGSITADQVNGAYTNLTGPVITETSAGQLVLNGFVNITLPSGYAYDTSVVPTATVTLAPGQNGQTQLGMVFDSFLGTTSARFRVTRASSDGGNRHGRVTFGNLRIRPTTGILPNKGNIINTGNTGPRGSNDIYGALEMIAGATTQIRVTASPTSGIPLPATSVKAGESITIYANTTDQYGNFKENVNTDTWELIDPTSGIQNGGSLIPSQDAKSAVFTGTTVGTTRIRATKSGYSANNSDILTVIPNDPHQLVIHTQPPGNAVAGVNFIQQPVLHVHDAYGNLVTSDNQTPVTTYIDDGEGSLQGNIDRLAVNGIVTYTNLRHNIAGTISLGFSSSGLNRVVSDEIQVSPTTPSKLIFVQQPTNAVPNTIISPPVEARILDVYNNKVFQEGLDITISKSVGSGNLSGTLTNSTDTLGIVTFSDLSINTAGTKRLTVSRSSNPALTSAESNPFQIANPGILTDFRVVAAGGDDIATQVAGEPFDIRIEAVDGNGDVVTGYNGTVHVNSSSLMASGSGETVSFNSGILESHQVTLETAGIHVLNVTNNTSVTGVSENFEILPAAYSLTTSSISAESPEIIANGNSSTTITVQLKDEFGNDLVTGGETVTILASEGSISPVTDMNNGKYIAELTSGTTAIDAVAISASVNSEFIISAPLEIDFIAGPLSTFLIEAEGGGNITSKIAGVDFQIQITALDKNENIVKGFSSTVTIGSNGMLLTGGGTTPGFTNGVLSSHSISERVAGQRIMRITYEGQVYESHTFDVSPGSASSSTSLISSSRVVIENRSDETALITVQLKDDYGNHLQTGGHSISLAIQTNNTSPVNASLGPPTDMGNGTFTAVLTASATVERVTITGAISGIPISDDAVVYITEFNEWVSGAGGPAANSWNNAENWALGTIPTPEQAVLVPTTPRDAIVYPVLKSGSVEVVFVILSEDATLTAASGTSLLVRGNIEGGGAFVGDQASITIQGNISVPFFNAGTSVVNLNGESQQEINSSMLTGTLNIDNSSPAGVTGEGYINADLSLNVNNSTLTIKNGAWLDIFGNVTGNGNLVGLNGSLIEIGGDVTIENSDVKEAAVVFNGSEIQNIGSSMSEYDNLTISNQAGVVFNGDLDLSGTLSLLNTGILEVKGNVTGTGMLQANQGTLRLGGDLLIQSSNLTSALVVMNGVTPQHLDNISIFNHLTIENKTGVFSNSDLTIDGVLTLNSGNLIMTSGTSLFSNNKVYDGGNLTFQRNIEGLKGWRMLSSPLNSTWGDLLSHTVTQGYNGATIDTLQPNVLWYDETYSGNSSGSTDNQRWRAPLNGEDSLQAGQGFFVYVFGDVAEDDRYNDKLPITLNVSGEEFTFPDDIIDFGVTYTADADTGWNLIGNPFGATLNWNSNAWAKENMDESIYVWDANANNGQGEYKVFNGITGSHDGRIPPFQGFWVKANEEPSLSFSKNGLTTGGMFYKMEKEKKEKVIEEQPALITLRLKKDDMESSTYFMFSDHARKGKDKYDAYRLRPMNDTYLELYSKLDDGSQLVINSLPKRSVHAYEIPLGVGGFRNGNSIGGEFTLSWPELRFVPESWILELTDHERKTTIDMTKQPSYTFTLAGDQPARTQKNTDPGLQIMRSSGMSGRFTVRVRPDDPQVNDIPEEFALEQNFPNPFNPSTTIQFALPEAAFVTLLVYDILGRQIATLTSQEYEAGHHRVEWDASRFSSGVYIYRIQAGSNTMTRKMTIIK